MSGFARRFLTLLLLLPISATAADLTRPVFQPPPPAVSSGSIVQIIFSLILVLGVIVLVAWLLKRANFTQLGTGSQLKVLGSVSIGQRERIVLVELNDTWLVIGVGPGQIRNLHTLPKHELPQQEGKLPAAAENKFAKLFASVMRR